MVRNLRALGLGQVYRPPSGIATRRNLPFLPLCRLLACRGLAGLGLRAAGRITMQLWPFELRVAGRGCRGSRRPIVADARTWPRLQGCHLLAGNRLTG